MTLNKLQVRYNTLLFIWFSSIQLLVESDHLGISRPSSKKYSSYVAATLALAICYLWWWCCCCYLVVVCCLLLLLFTYRLAFVVESVHQSISPSVSWPACRSVSSLELKMNKFFLIWRTLDLFLHEARKPAISHLCCYCCSSCSCCSCCSCCRCCCCCCWCCRLVLFPDASTTRNLCPTKKQKKKKLHKNHTQLMQGGLISSIGF